MESRKDGNILETATEPDTDTKENSMTEEDINPLPPPPPKKIGKRAGESKRKDVDKAKDKTRARIKVGMQVIEPIFDL